MKGGDGGDVLLMLDVPDEVIAKHRPKQRATHTAYQVPARDLTNYKIELARTDYAGTTRDMLVGLIKDREAKEAEGREPPKPGSKWSTSQSYRDALAFLDRFAPLP